MSKFYIDSGKIKKIQECSISADYVFGINEMIYETVRLVDTQPLFLKQHLQNMRDTIDVLLMSCPSNFTYAEISKQISRLLNVNKVYKGGVCKIILYRKSSVFETYTSTELSYALFIQALEHATFSFNTKGIRLALHPSVLLQKPLLYSMYSAHMVVQHKSKQLLQTMGADAIAYFNESADVFHSSHGDVFYIKNKVVYCPSPEINTFRFPLSDFLLQNLSKIDMKYVEQTACTIDSFLQADEVFIVNPLHGVQWVVSCNETTYMCKFSRQIFTLLATVSE